MNEMNQSQEIILFIDRLRADRNITQEDFLHGVVSMRQYRRYLRGDSSMSYSLIEQLAKRLGFDSEMIILELETEKLKQTQQISNLYNLVVSRSLEKAYQQFQTIDYDRIISEKDQLLYNHSVNMFNFFSGKVNQKLTIERTKDLIELPKLLKKKAMSSSELLTLVSFFFFDEYKEINIIAEKLASYIENNITIVTGHNIKVVTLVLEELSRYFSISENYEKMLYYAEEGIKYANTVRSYYLLETLYFFAAAASFELDLIKQRNDYLKKCYIVLMIEGNEVKMQRYRDNFKQNFDVDIKDLFEFV